MVQKLVRQAFDEAGAKPAEADLKKYYEDHLEEFVKPERVRVSAILLRAARGAPDRAKKAGEAAKLLVRLKTEGKKNSLAFTAIARDASEDFATKETGGDLGFRTRDDLARQVAPEVAAAAFGLKDPGQESGIVETAQGFYFLKLGARQAGVNRTFEEVRPQLAARIGREKRTKDFDDYVKGLREKAGIKVNDAEVEKVAVTGGPGGAEVSTGFGASDASRAPKGP